MCKTPSEPVLMRLYDIKFNNKKACIIQTVRIFYSSVIKHVRTLVIWHVQQNNVKCFIIPLPLSSHVYWLCTLNTFSDQTIICQISFEIFHVKQNSSKQCKYLNSIRVFPFFILFFCWNEINKKSPIKEDARKIENCKTIKEDKRKMENCKANNIPEKRFLQNYWK